MFASCCPLDQALAAGVSLGDNHEAIAVLRRVEALRRKTATLVVAVQGEVGASAAFRADGHASAKAMVRHVGRLSPREAAGQARRVGDAVVDAHDLFITTARQPSHLDHELAVRHWERHADEDGPEPENSRRHDQRNTTLVQDFDPSWRLEGDHAALPGASMDDIYRHHIDAERLADGERARADATWQRLQDAASADGTAVPPGFVARDQNSAVAIRSAL